MGKNSNGLGTIRKRDDGTWHGKIYLGKKPNGKEIRPNFYGKTKAEVQEKILEAKRNRKRELAKVTHKDSLATFSRQWLDDYVAVERADATFADYELGMSYVLPYIGTLSVPKIEPADVQRMLSQQGKDGFTNAKRKKAFRTLSSCLGYAVKPMRIIQMNPCTQVEPPKVESEERSYLPVKEITRVLKVCKHDRIGDIVLLAVMTGMRQGELFALAWEDVDFEAKTIDVKYSISDVRGKPKTRKETKTKNRRIVVMNEYAELALRNRLAKALKENFTPEVVPWVFPAPMGGWLSRSNFNKRTWRDICNVLDVKAGFTFHDLRHSQATFAIAAGADILTLSKTMGHSKVQTTLDTYGHLMTGAKKNMVTQTADFIRIHQEADEVA